MPPKPNYVAQLLMLVPSFSSSNEFVTLSDDERASPGLVFSAFAKFIEASLGDQSLVVQCANAIEHLARMQDDDLDNLLVTEVFESFCHPTECRKLLLPNSGNLYDKWLG